MGAYQPSPQRSSPYSPVTAFLAAFEFLTIFPSGLKRAITPAELGQATGFYPMVGLGLGAILAGVGFLLHRIIPAGLSSVLILILWVIATGGLHLDGFLDACDGLFGGHTPQERLAIMSDERLGAFGLAGGVLLMLCKYAALNAIQNPSIALLIAPVLGRWGMTLALTIFPYGKSQGVGREIKDHISRRELALATATALLVSLLGGWAIGMIAFSTVALLVWAGGRFVMRRIPGMTGDIYGALNEIVEAMILVIFAIR